MGGISNGEIEKAFRDLGDPDLLDNFVGVFTLDYLNRFVNHAAMINNSGKYPFIIANTDDSQKDETQWWSILDIEPKTDIFFRLVRTGWTKTLYNTERQINNRQNTGGNRQNGQN